ncbi:glycosyltransferase [bacterium]|nr:glycosyltransferase [bacterium]
MISSLSYRKYYGASRLKNLKYLRKYRKTNIQIINDNIDVVLAVSNRVRDIMIEHGINKDKIFTSYIGTKFAENEKRESVAPKNTIFTLAYLGFEKVDKGYFFMIDALSKLPIEYQKKINIVLAVANFNPNNIKGKLDNFNDVKIFKGYNHNELGNILQNVHLGLVPVLWEDNLPQVAIEMVACGVPILCSSFGGASELCKDELFKFEGGNTNKMLQKIMQFVDNKQLLDLYWNQHPPLTTMTNHIQELFKFYGGETNA